MPKQTWSAEVVALFKRVWPFSGHLALRGSSNPQDQQEENFDFDKHRAKKVLTNA